MSKKYAICRVQKRHDLKQVGRSEGHNLRAYQTAHADPSGVAPRVLFGSKGLTTQLREVLPEKPSQGRGAGLRGVPGGQPGLVRAASA